VTRLLHTLPGSGPEGSQLPVVLILFKLGDFCQAIEGESVQLCLKNNSLRQQSVCHLNRLNDRLYPVRPWVSAHALTIHHNRLLVVKRGAPPAKGLWSVPGGAIDLGETVEECLKREVFEETGIEIEVKDFLRYVDVILKEEATGNIQYHYVVLYFKALYIGGELRPSSDAADAQWLTSDEIRQLPVTETLPKLLDQLKL
jgi:8-oxo-dGTP diphosphatase